MTFCINDRSVNSPDILFLPRDPLRGLEWITSDHHCGAVSLTKSLVWSKMTGYSSIDDWPLEHRVHMLLRVGEKRR